MRGCLELDLRSLARCLCGLKAGARLELEYAGEDVAGEGLDAVVVVEHAVVVALAGVGDLVLGLLERGWSWMKLVFALRSG